ncbi:hypothetical protein, partial [Pseudomonas syringae]|uniref:hypothetical protein n=1 Tax=Pseudomonas syringae TaxID=317 RepID=UPI0005162392
GELQQASALAERGAKGQVHCVTPLLAQTVRPVFQMAISCGELKNTQRSASILFAANARATALLVADPGSEFPQWQEIHDLKYLRRNARCAG